MRKIGKAHGNSIIGVYVCVCVWGGGSRPSNKGLCATLIYRLAILWTPNS